MADVRVLGAIGVIQLAGPVDVAAATAGGDRARCVAAAFRDLVYVMPPYVTDGEDLARIASAAVAAAEAGAPR